VVELGDLPRQAALDVPSRRAALGRLGDELLHLVGAQIGGQAQVLRHQMVRDPHQLAELLLRRVVQVDAVVQALGHLLDAVGAAQQRHGHHDLAGLTAGALQLAAEQQVEGLVGAAQLDVGLDGHRVHALHERVEELDQRDRAAGVVAGLEILPLQKLGHGDVCRQVGHLREGHRRQPLGVVPDLGR
jgi:hypothetical protein